MIIAIVAILVSVSQYCLAATPDLTLYNATTYGAEVRVVLHLIDQDGNPVSGALITGAMLTGGDINDYSAFHGKTDIHGFFTIEGKCTDFLRCTIEKDGYYSSEFKYYCYRRDLSPAIVDGKWQPYGQIETVMLKRIINPRPLILNGGLKSFEIPVYGEWIGFDCQLFDFNPPFGKGEEVDFLLRFTLNRASKKDYHMTMEVSFTNHPHAGAYMALKDKFSDFQSAYYADTNASFASNLVYKYDRSPGERAKYVELDENHYLIFRTRTHTNEIGRLCSAHYGKIFGKWNFVGPKGMNIEQLVFNPNSNDANLEDEHTANYSRMLRRQRQEHRLESEQRKKQYRHEILK